jgi:acetyl-CoA carboxylase carboxyl transferase subunit beta
VDMVVKRHDIPTTLARVLKILMKKPMEAAKLDVSGALAALPIAASASV